MSNICHLETFFYLGLDIFKKKNGKVTLTMQ